MSGVRVNEYECGLCGGSILTREDVAGVTPMFMACRATVGCPGRMVSAMYPKAVQGRADEAGWEWFRPAGRELGRLRGAIADHVRRGGLLLRPVERGVA